MKRREPDIDLDVAVITDLVDSLLWIQEGFERDGYPQAADLMFDLTYRCDAYLKEVGEGGRRGLG